jgi:thioesterase domain-containing protein
VIPQAANFGREYLQERIGREFMLARHIGVVVETAGDAAVVLRAPLGPNANHQGTAFGGSLYSLSVLTGWAWLTRYLAARNISADAVIQESNMRFLIPVEGELRACAESPSAAQLARFRKMLQRAGRGRISLRVHITYRETLATLFEGVFVAAMRR